MEVDLMKKYARLTLMLTLVSWFLAGSLWAQTKTDSNAQTEVPKAGGPKLVMKQKEFHFGDVAEGDVLSHEFVVSNEGDAVLQIQNVKPG